MPMFKRLRTYWEKQKIFREIGSFDESGLVYAAEEGNLECLAILLKAGLNTNAISERGVPALCRAVEKDNLPAVRMLVEAGANLNLGDSKGTTPLMRAIKSTNRHIFNFLLEQDPDLEIMDQSQETALFKAVKEGNTTLTRKLIEAGSEVDLINSDGCTPLMYATETERIGIVKTLLASGADPNIQNRAGKTVLDFSVQSPRLQRMLRRAGMERRQEERRSEGQNGLNGLELLAPFSASMLAQFPRLGELVFNAMDTTLQVLNSPYSVDDAAEKGRKVMNNFVNPQNGNGNANSNGASHHNGHSNGNVSAEVLAQQLESLMGLVQKPISSNGTVSPSGLSQEKLDQALLESARVGAEQVVNLLLELGASPSATDKTGNTPLHLAIKFLPIVKLLVAKKANASLANQDGKTPLDLARSGNHMASLELLYQRPAEPSNDE